LLNITEKKAIPTSHWTYVTASHCCWRCSDTHQSFLDIASCIAMLRSRNLYTWHVYRNMHTSTESALIVGVGSWFSRTAWRGTEYRGHPDCDL